MTDGGWLARWIILFDAAKHFDQTAAAHLVAPPDKTTFTEIEGTSAYAIKASDVRATFVVVGRQDRPMSSAGDIVSRAIAEAKASLPDDAEDGGQVGPP